MRKLLFDKTNIMWCMLLVLIFVQQMTIFSYREQLSETKHQLTLANIRANGLFDNYQKLQQEFDKQLIQTKAQVVDLTAYTPSEDQCDSDPLIAASLKPVREGTIAVSRDLFRAGWVFGKKVHIEGYGIYTINDLMNKRFEKRIDIFMWSYSDAISFGKKEAIATLL